MRHRLPTLDLSAATSELEAAGACVALHDNLHLEYARRLELLTVHGAIQASLGIALCIGL